ncbi:Hippocampus abundant transcript 1 protein [Geodia barretti]|uniref:Hippocampus abundant transcript 1 protein n=1 Tax=Geodia barretti TaxID=519541 RepID=A0AA35XAR7_GEOBA|nr:Hippocampus abundant transcript 1 protein [Geodia barretti]
MTCAPIPILLFSPVAYFVAVAISGVFAVTFSIVFAYVADCTIEDDRSSAYGLVSATFAASLVISPALGTWIEDHTHGQAQVILLATMITIFNLVFIVFMVPESLPEKSRKASWGAPITWEQADPFAALRKATTDWRLLHLSVVVFLSYLPEAGQYSCFFLYLKQFIFCPFTSLSLLPLPPPLSPSSLSSLSLLPPPPSPLSPSSLSSTNQVVGFSLGQVAIFIAVLCVTSVVAQTAGLTLLMSLVGNKYCIIVGLFLQATQLVIYGISTSTWLMWVAGMLAASASIIYPAISAMVSRNAEPEQQGVVLGILTVLDCLFFVLCTFLIDEDIRSFLMDAGIRGLCNGLGPALFGLLFWLSDVHLSDSSVNIDPALAGAQATDIPAKTNTTAASIPHLDKENRLFLGIPFLIGAFPVFLALLVAFCIKDKPTTIRKSPSEELIPLRETPHRHLRNSVS